MAGKTKRKRNFVSCEFVASLSKRFRLLFKIFRRYWNDAFEKKNDSLYSFLFSFFIFIIIIVTIAFLFLTYYKKKKKKLFEIAQSFGITIM